MDLCRKRRRVSSPVLQSYWTWLMDRYSESLWQRSNLRHTRMLLASFCCHITTVDCNDVRRVRIAVVLAQKRRCPVRIQTCYCLNNAISSWHKCWLGLQRWRGLAGKKYAWYLLIPLCGNLVCNSLSTDISNICFWQCDLKSFVFGNITICNLWKLIFINCPYVG